MIRVPFSNLGRQYETIREEILDAMDSVFRTGNVLNGDKTLEFEQTLATMCQRKHAITVNSATQGLTFAQMATSIENFLNKVLIPEISFRATLNSVEFSGHHPVFCVTDQTGMMDIVNFTKHLDESLVDYGITHIMWVNLYGNIIDYTKLVTVTELFNNEKIVLIEDAAQSFGSKRDGRPSGSFGDVSVISFDPTKNLNNYGSGGCVLTNDDLIADRIKSIRNNNKKNDTNVFGTNSMMSEADCASMMVKLKYFDKWQKRRSDIAEYYIQELQDRVKIMLPSEGVESNWHKFVIQVDDRNKIFKSMISSGIEVKIHYDYLLSELNHNANKHSYRPPYNSFKVISSVMSLPIYPELSDYEIEQVVIALKSCNL